jgi:hypothetical protein
MADLKEAPHVIPPGAQPSSFGIAYQAPGQPDNLKCRLETGAAIVK